ncbi:MAG: T9SS type A sorting domain-containing protein [Bacteroidales bacterium]|nr:T9SS type A sorting domain-containing protein [Bacteroidales bacterium]
MKIKIFLTLFLVLSFSLVKGQELVGSAGGSFVNATYSMDWSVGEIATATYSAGSFTLSEGLHQNFITVEAIDQVAEFGISVFPNPTSDFININSSEIENFDVQIVDANGRSIINQNVAGNQTQIDFSNFANGIYILSINKNNQTQTFKLVKK